MGLFLLIFLFLGGLGAWAHLTRRLPLWWLFVRARVDKTLLGVALTPSTFTNQVLTKPRERGTKMTYAHAGVSRERAEEVVSAIKVMARDTHTPAVTMAEFGGIFEFDKTRKALIASTDGVGTKTQFLMERMISPEAACNVLGRDIVHNNINDILVHGGRPLFFLDYLACARLNTLQISTLVAAIANSCKAHGCVLLGGETTEMPSVFTKPSDMEIVGFVVGEVHPSAILDGSKVSAGDLVYGIPSSGPHTNGYSLLAKLYPPGDPALETFPELFAPHRSYFHQVYPLLHGPETKEMIHGLVHVTGGGWDENTYRILKTTGLSVVWEDFDFAPVYKDIQKRSGLDWFEMLDTFNCGYGMLVICDPAMVVPDNWACVGEIQCGRSHCRFRHEMKD